MAKLTVVPTPVGNLEDMTFRAIRVLKEADLILAEDTRTTGILLKHFEIQNKMQSHHKFNEHKTVEQIASRIKGGENIALVSDAGTPAISDPGEDLVALCAEHDVPVLVVPGPSAVISALAVSGLPTGRFTFEGFLSVNKKSRKDHLESVKNEVRTMVFYEAPHKLPYTLRDMAEIFGDRRIALVREITKIHEECVRTTLYKAAEYYEQNAPKGEFVLVIEGAKAEEQKEMTLEDAVEAAKKAIENGSSASDAAKEAAKLSGFKKGEIYKALMN
jgi:16S rRNA (cytidine1402-2'-O)-methyltransferase